MSKKRPTTVLLYSEAVCHGCPEVSEREEGGSSHTTRWARQHQRQHPPHRVFVEQGRMLIYEPGMTVAGESQ